MVSKVLFSLGILLTPVIGLIPFRLLLRTGLVTDGVAKRDVWYSSDPVETYVYISAFHKVLAIILGFLIPWILVIVAYVFIVDWLLPTPPV